MISYLSLPLAFLKFWYREAPYGILGYFLSLNHAFLELFSLPLFLRTFFKPLKNEYRQGLVGFSRAMGIVVKSLFIIIDIILLSLLVIFELSVLAFFLIFPILTVWILYAK